MFFHTCEGGVCRCRRKARTYSISTPAHTMVEVVGEPWVRTYRVACEPHRDHTGSYVTVRTVTETHLGVRYTSGGEGCFRSRRRMKTSARLKRAFYGDDGKMRTFDIRNAPDFDPGTAGIELVTHMPMFAPVVPDMVDGDGWTCTGPMADAIRKARYAPRVKRVPVVERVSLPKRSANGRFRKVG